MTITEPIPGNYGQSNWVDYSNYWREADAEWIQARSILRYATNATRDSNLTSPGVGQVVYNEALDILQLRSKTGAWRNYAGLPGNLTATQDNSAGVAISHVDAAGKGVIFGPNDVQINHALKVLTNVVQVDATGVSFKTGAKTAKLTTDATSLVSDSPMNVPSLTLTGAGTVFSAPGKTIAVGTVTADNVTLAAGTVTGVLTAGSGSIGGVGVGTVANRVDASAGFVAQGGYHYGDATSAILRQRNTSSGALGAPYVQTTANEVNVSGLMRYYGQNNGIAYYDAGANFRGWMAPAIWGGDPGVGNVPEGTIWIS